MEEQIDNNPEIKLADDLASKGNRAFLSYTWKLNKSHDDSYNSSDANPYSDDNWANDISYPEHDLEMAFDYYQQALAKYQNVLGSDHIKTGEILFNCGRVCMDPMYDDVIALDFLERALPIYQIEKPYSRDLAILYEDLGSICYALNKLPSSLDYYNKSLSLFNELAICGEEEDISSLEEKINDAEGKLGLHIIHTKNKYGFADKEGNVIIPCVWNDAQEFSEGLAGVKNEENLCGFINYQGELVIPCCFRNAYSFKDGMAYVEANIDDIFPHTVYIDKDDYRIANDLELLPYQIDAIYKAYVLAKHGKHLEAAECITPAVSSYDPSPLMRQISYYFLAEQYGKLLEKCKSIVKYDERSTLVVFADILLGACYEQGRGVEKDLMQAFKYLNAVRIEDDVSDEDYQQLDDFLERHPEMKEFPEVQDALAQFDDDDEY